MVPKLKVTRNAAAFAQFLNQLLDEFGGYTLDRENYGTWRDGAGVTHDDVNLPVLVSVPDDRASLDTFKGLAAGLAQDLNEHCLFASIGQRETVFIWARLADGPRPLMSSAALRADTAPASGVPAV